MSGILDLVQQSLGGDAVQRISQQLGADPQQAQSAIGTALPMLLAGMAHHSQEGGADVMHAAVSQHDGGLLDNLGGLLGGGAPTQTHPGAGGLLDLVLGQHTDTAHAAVAGASGLQTAQVQQLLAMLAPQAPACLLHAIDDALVRDVACRGGVLRGALLVDRREDRATVVGGRSNDSGADASMSSVSR